MAASSATFSLFALASTNRTAVRPFLFLDAEALPQSTND